MRLGLESEIVHSNSKGEVGLDQALRIASGTIRPKPTSRSAATSGNLYERRALCHVSCVLRRPFCIDGSTRCTRPNQGAEDDQHNDAACDLSDCLPHQAHALANSRSLTQWCDVRELVAARRAPGLAPMVAVASYIDSRLSSSAMLHNDACSDPELRATPPGIAPRPWFYGTRRRKHGGTIS
jgi:hypothetical protein